MTRVSSCGESGIWADHLTLFSNPLLFILGWRSIVFAELGLTLFDQM